MSFKAEVKAAVGWDWNDGVPDNGRLQWSTRFSKGTGPGQAETLWRAENHVLAAAQSDVLDLTCLPRSILGGTLTSALTSVRGIVVINHAPAGELVVGGAGGDEWSAPFGADGDTLVLAPQSAVTLTNSQQGWPVDRANRLLRLMANGGPVTYSIALLGTTTVAPPGSGSGS
jgi:hypothetical protein